MQLYRNGSHTVFDLKYHIVWTTKYRKPILNTRLAMRVRELIREIARANEVTIIKGHVSKDHVHLFVSLPPSLSVSKITQLWKGKTSRKVQQEDKQVSKQFWGQHFWARGYFAVSSGSVTDEAIMEYIKHQDEDEDKRGDSFTITNSAL
jgi:putative transposase